MLYNSEHVDEVKRKLRSLKKLEIKIRFGHLFHGKNPARIPSKAVLVWDEFFNINDTLGSGNARYSLSDIVSKSRDDFKNIVDEFFFNVYYKYYMENGITHLNIYDPSILKWMDLPQNAVQEDIKKRFRELAKKYHPDTGGDSSKFIELMENYKKLIE